MSSVEDYKRLIQESVLDSKAFLRLTLSSPPRGADMLWVKVVVRPITLKAQPHLQIKQFSPTQDLTQNCARTDAADAIADLLALPFRQIHVQTTAEDLHVRITAKNRVLFKRSRPSRPHARPDRAHNRVKRHPIPGDRPDAFLQGLGIMDKSGQVRATMRNKYRQINAFLNLLQPVIPRLNRPLRLVDAGCGSAYLTLSAYHYLTHIQNAPAQLTGIDHNAALIEKNQNLVAELGWTDVAFRTCDIADFTPKAPPDLVMSLHACDTATDEAIAQAVKWGSDLILAAPCCQHELRLQLDAPLFAPVLEDGILKGRIADALTDACRAHILRILGYRTDVVEFIDSRHTPKNLMIRAKKTSRPGDVTRVREYCQLRDFWNIQPSLETFLSAELVPFLT